MKVFYVSEDVSGEPENEPLMVIVERCLGMRPSRMTSNYSRFNGRNLINQLMKSPERVFCFAASLPHELTGEVVLVLHVDADSDLDKRSLCEKGWSGVTNKSSVTERIENGKLKLKVVIASPDPCLEAWILMKSGERECGALKDRIERAGDPVDLAEQVDINALEKTGEDFADFMGDIRKTLNCENPCQPSWPQ